MGYAINFLVKTKNDIIDFSRITITINANSGLIESYNGGPLKKLDYSYVPKISKDYVLTKYNEERMKLNASIDISKIGLDRRVFKGHNRWMWTIYGIRKDKDMGTAAMMFFDSETGELLFKRMD